MFVALLSLALLIGLAATTSAAPPSRYRPAVTKANATAVFHDADEDQQDGKAVEAATDDEQLPNAPDPDDELDDAPDPDDGAPPAPLPDDAGDEPIGEVPLGEDDESPAPDETPEPTEEAPQPSEEEPSPQLEEPEAAEESSAPVDDAPEPLDEEPLADDSETADDVTDEEPATIDREVGGDRAPAELDDMEMEAEASEDEEFLPSYNGADGESANEDADDEDADDETNAEKVDRGEPEPEPDGLTRVASLQMQVMPEGQDFPGDLAGKRFQREGWVHASYCTSRPWAPMYFSWEATALCHGALYFEEPNLERLGYSAGILQPAVSAAHFFGTIPALPYLVAAHPLKECVFTLGQHRAGSHAPLSFVYPRIDPKAALFQGGVVAGLILLIP